jgi:hypothetical protein
MKTLKQKCQIVMLSTENKYSEGLLCIRIKDGKLYKHTRDMRWYGINQHFYILSNDEIQEGDYVYENNLNQETSIYQIYKRNYRLCFFRFSNVPVWLDKTYHTAKKIIATTDNSLKIPEISEQQIGKYIKMYNQGNPIDEVLVEYEQGEEYVDPEYPIAIGGGYEYNLKVNLKDNTINIHSIKDSWNREELSFMKGSTGNHIKLIYEHLINIYHESPNYDYMIKLKNVSDWIEENL